MERFLGILVGFPNYEKSISSKFDDTTHRDQKTLENNTILLSSMRENDIDEFGKVRAHNRIKQLSSIKSFLFN